MPGKPKGARPASKPAGAKVPGWAKEPVVSEANVHFRRHVQTPGRLRASRTLVATISTNDGRRSGLGYQRGDHIIFTHFRRHEFLGMGEGGGDFHKSPEPIIKDAEEVRPNLHHPVLVLNKQRVVRWRERGGGYSPPVTVIAP
jgi:hypothetical protein